MREFWIVGLTLALLPACDRRPERARPAEETRMADERAAERDRERSRLEWRRFCSELGARRVAQERQDLRGSDWGQVPPFYCYHEARNTCVYSGGTMSPKGLMQLEVVDLMTNETLSSHLGQQGQRATAEERADRATYDKKRDELMTGCVLR